MHGSSALTDPLEFLAPLSPFQLEIRCDPRMYRRSTDSLSSPAYRQPMERTSSRDHSSPASVGNGGFTAQSTDSPRTSHKRARSNSSASSHINLDRSGRQDRNTWPAGPPPTTVQRTSSHLQRSPSTSGRNSQSSLQLHRSVSNSSASPTHIQRTHSNQPSPTRSRRISRTPQRPILFYHKHEPHYGFTNFSNHGVKYEGKIYPTSEHLFQSLKVCALFQPAPDPSDPTDLLVCPPSIVG